MDARNEVRDEAVKRACVRFQDALSQGYALNITHRNQARQHVDAEFGLYDGASDPDPEMPVDDALPETSEGDVHQEPAGEDDFSLLNIGKLHPRICLAKAMLGIPESKQKEILDAVSIWKATTDAGESVPSTHTLKKDLQELRQAYECDMVERLVAMKEFDATFGTVPAIPVFVRPLCKCIELALAGVQPEEIALKPEPLGADGRVNSFAQGSLYRQMYKVPE
jgi:hypothetical protein